MIEILAPAGSPESLKVAAEAGADAVYLGLRSFSARRNAKNFTEDELREAARVCRLSGINTDSNQRLESGMPQSTDCRRCRNSAIPVSEQTKFVQKQYKLYLALNTLIFDRELPELRRTVQTAAEAGADAFIIQDLAVLQLVKEVAPDVKYHASTQMTITSVSGAKAAKKLGFSRVVLARELSLSEIAEITRSIDIETEVFVHGALCTSVSGQCHMSAFFGGSDSVRSANRGLCAQPCRLNFKAHNADYILSLKDLSIIKNMKELEKAGVTSVKIEGRMKSPEYVSAAVKACVKARRGEQYDEKTLQAIFSRGGFTDGYFTGETCAMRGHRAEENNRGRRK
ncbi:MAG: U32 family peptidase [Oscillospiraceae bacterium]|nr:U32 family peptidase [Oscillospiraceae bacterium]